MKTMIAKYPGTCFECGKPIQRGDLIRYYGRLHCEHAECTDGGKPEQSGPDHFDLMIEDQMRDACGC
jgi:hypothetical protein